MSKKPGASKFPIIPNVEFKMIPGYDDQYAIASNRTIWIRFHSWWKKKRSHFDSTKTELIKLEKKGQPIKVDDLMKIFDKENI